MEIKLFDIDLGVYSFVAEDIRTEGHQHPALELIVAHQGEISVYTNEKALTNVKACMIRANTLHAVQSNDTRCSIFMIENELLGLKALSASFGVNSEGSSIVELELEDDPSLDRFIEGLIENASLHSDALDGRIAQCRRIIHSSVTNGSVPMRHLSLEVHLSVSRLSHLFRSECGITIRNYIIWERLKHTIHAMLGHNLSLQQAAYRSGFHDLPHFNKAFRKMLGLNPSVVYNSRIVQI